jgi:hypothetical protein
MASDRGIKVGARKRICIELKKFLIKASFAI